MTRRRIWTENLDAVLLDEMEARGNKSIAEACRSLKDRDQNFSKLTVKAVVRRYDKLRQQREAEVNEGPDHEGKGQTAPRPSSGKIWTAEENQRLIDAYNHRGKILLKNLVQSLVSEGAFPGRSPEALAARIRDCKLGRQIPRWSDEEHHKLVSRIECLGKFPHRRIAQLIFDSGEFPGRTLYALRCRVYDILGLGSRVEGKSDEEEDYGGLASVSDKPNKYTVSKMMNVRVFREDGSFLVVAVPKTIGTDLMLDGGPPDRNDIELLLVPLYGGGEYFVINSTTKQVHKRFKFDGPPKDPDAPGAFAGKSPSPIARTLDDDKHPLIKVMLLLPRARDNPEAWDNIFPRALAAAESVCVDIDKARAELEKTAMAVKMIEALHKKKKEETDQLKAEMEACEAALEREKLVDKQVEQGG